MCLKNSFLLFLLSSGSSIGEIVIADLGFSKLILIWVVSITDKTSSKKFEFIQTALSSHSTTQTKVTSHSQIWVSVVSSSIPLEVDKLIFI